MPTRHRPRRGSLAFSPRKRAKSEIGRIRRKGKEIVEGKKIQGFAGYKAGMTQLVLVDGTPHSLTKGQEIAVPATIIETPPIRIEGVRIYQENYYGKKAVTEVGVSGEETGEYEDKDEHDWGMKMEKIEAMVEEGAGDGVELRLIASTKPDAVPGVPKKKKEIMEIKMSGEIEKDLVHAKEVLGKVIKAREVFKEGEFVDVTAVTKGKGTQGPVKRWGVMIQRGKAKRSSRGRHVGTIGSWTPSKVSWRVPQQGQMGYHQRTEYNKQILKIGEDGSEISPEGGFIRYGNVKNEYILLKGSVPGPKKRLIRLTPAIRQKPHFKPGMPEIVYISRGSQQG